MTYFDDDLPVAAMKRAMAEPGKFAATWPSLSDAEVANYVADGFGAARLAGWFGRSTYDADALQVTPDISDAGLALVINYASVRVLRSRLLALQAGKRYKAGPVEMETTAAATVLSALLSSAEAEIESVRRMVMTRVTPYIGDLVSIRLMGQSGLTFETTELPVFRLTREEF